MNLAKPFNCLRKVNENQKDVNLDMCLSERVSFMVENSKLKHCIGLLLPYLVLDYTSHVGQSRN